jgi:hypothetical protein
VKLCALSFLVLAIAACAPPYSAELNTSAGLASQMNLLADFGPVNSPDGDATTAIKFLPTKPTVATINALSLQSGFLVSESPGYESLRFAFQDPSGNVQTTGGVGSFSLAGADPNYPLYQYAVLTPILTTVADILVLKMDPATATTADLYRATLTNNAFSKLTPPPTENLLDLWGRPVVGFQLFPLPGADRFGFLFDNGSPLDGDGTANLNGSATVFDTPVAGNTNIQFPGTQKRALFYNNGQTGSLYRSYASYYNAGQWACCWWKASGIAAATPLPGVTHRIDALLTSGDLLSTEDATLRMYDPDGLEVLSVGLRALQFCYEAYVGSTPYVFFSLTMGFPHNNWVFRTYAVPTSALRGLKD